MLVECGGNWCSWCVHLKRFFADHPALTELRDKHYVLVMLNVPASGPPPPALTGWPPPPGYPHLYVLDENGTVLKSQSTGELESGESYSPSKFADFLNAYSLK